MTDIDRAVATSTDPDFVRRQLGLEQPIGYGILRPGDRVRFTGRSVRHDARAHNWLTLGASYEVESCEVYLGKVRLRLKGGRGLRFLRSMFDVVA